MQGVMLPVETLAEALRQNKGMVAVTARAVGMARTSLARRIAQSQTLQEVVKDARELVTDTAELALHKKILEGEAWAVCFYLKTQGKDRGYVEREEHTGVGGGPITFTIKIDRGDDDRNAELRAPLAIRPPA